MLLSASDTSFESSVWRSVAVVEDLRWGSGELRLKSMLRKGATLPLLQGIQNSRDGFVGHISSDGVFDLELLLLLVESPADDVKIDGFNNKIL